MNNAEKFKSIFGIYATELWSMPEEEFLAWLNAEAKTEDWISVTGALPKEDGDYLVTFESGYADDYGLEPIGIAPFEVDCEGFGIWQESFDRVSLGSLGSEWVNIQVTAWRPLPKPYKAEKS